MGELGGSGMSAEELCGELQNLYKLLDEPNKDEEDLHTEADRLLLEYINHPEVTRVFSDLPKWYS